MRGPFAEPRRKEPGGNTGDLTPFSSTPARPERRGSCLVGALGRALLVLALAAVALPAGAAVFNYLPTAPNVSPAGTGWQDVDVSAYLPVGATGVIVQYIETVGSSDQDFGLRKKGSTDGFFTDAAKANFQGWMMTGVDSSRTFQVYRSDVSVQIYLLGYTMPGVTFFTNRIDKSAPGAGLSDVSIAADTGSDTAIGAIFHAQNSSGSSIDYVVRKKGSTDNRFTGLRADNVNVVIIGVDGNETAEQRIATTPLDLYLVGYVTSGAVFFTNAVDKSTGSTGSYQSVDITADVGANAANGAFLEIYNSGNGRRQTALRPGGAGYDYYVEVQHQWALVGLDSGDVFEQKIENTEMDVYMVGYSLGDTGPTFRVTSGSYVGNGTGQAITGVGFQPDTVIVDGDGGGGQSAIRTSTMTGANSKDLDGPNVLSTTQILSLDPDGFTLGTDADANQAGITYNWVAFEAAPGYMKVGTYTGSGGAQNITGVGFSPSYVVVLPSNFGRPNQRSVDMPANFSMTFDSGGRTDAILALQANGFRVGTNAEVSSSGIVYHYVAWNGVPGRIATGSYAGNLSDDRDITGVGLWPEYVVLSRSADIAGGQGNAPAHKTASSGVNLDGANLFDANTFTTNRIQALQADGFQVGNDCQVNGDGSCAAPAPVAYYWAAFGPHVAASLYRSVGTNAGDLNIGRTVEITGRTATFSGAMPDNVGVGDVLQYQVTGTWYLAFVEARASDQVYTVGSSTGDTPRPAPASTSVSVFRAYTSLSSWQAQVENTSIEDTVEDFDTSRDLVAAGTAMVAACYADGDGSMDDMVSIAGWATSPDNYVRVFTPVHGHLVGTSQRHSGVAGTGFRLTPVSAAVQGFNVINLNAAYVRLEGLEIDGSGLSNATWLRGIAVQKDLPNVGDIRIDGSIVHDIHTRGPGSNWENTGGIFDFQDVAGSGPPLRITNNVIYGVSSTVFLDNHHISGIHIGSRTTSYVQNNTIFNIYNQGGGNPSGAARGLTVKAFPNLTGTATVIATNNVIGDVRADYDVVASCYNTQENAVLTQSFNVASDNTASGTGSVDWATTYASYFVDATLVGGRTTATTDLHLLGVSASLWGPSGTDLSADFSHDVDIEPRTVPWDIGADEFAGTTAVRLMSFDVSPLDSAVALTWRTGSELQNLGFHLHRSLSATGPWTRVTPALIPGQGSSPQGAAYSWTDTGLVNGTRYFYRLEDVDTASVSTFHGPVSAVPQAAPGGAEEEGSGEPPAPLPGTGTSPGGGSPTPGEPPPPGEGETPPANEPEPVCSDDGRCLYGDPGEPTLRVLSRSPLEMTVELSTPGFVASPDPAGVSVDVTGFVSPNEAQAVDLPFKRAVLDAVVGRRARLVSVEASDELSWAALRPAAVAAPAVDSRPDGTVRAVRARIPLTSSALGVPRARLAGSAFMGHTKKLALELHPLRWDPAQGRLVLSKTLRVTIAFVGDAGPETGDGSIGRRNPRARSTVPVVFAHLHATSRGLHAVSYEDVFPRAGRPLPLSALRLVQGGRVVPVHVEPPTGAFGPGSVLFFHVDREAASTDFSPEISFALERTAGGVEMARDTAQPLTGPTTSAPLGLARFETNRIYQSGLLQAPDVWLWEFAQSGMTKNVALDLAGVDLASALSARVRVFLQGASDAGVSGEHHMSFALNGVSLGETSFEGMVPHVFEGTIAASSLVEGTNTLAFTNVGDTGVVSRVFLDRVEVEYPETSALLAGRFGGAWTEEGVAQVALAPGAGDWAALRHSEGPVPGLGPKDLSVSSTERSFVASPGQAPQDDGGSRGSRGLVTGFSSVFALDVTDPASPVWLSGLEPGPGSVRMQVEPGRRYQVITPDGLFVPRVSHPVETGLRDTRNQADYVLVAPRAFMDAAQPLLLRRESQGLTTFAASLEDIAQDFGGGAPSAEAIRDFLAFAYHSWQQPSPRYVLLLGDSSFDPRNFTGFDQGAPLPALWAKTSYLWTASDPAIAAVNGEDLLPDLALGRLPATNLAQAEALVQKVLDWEDAGYDLGSDATLVADNPDQAGDFEADIADIRQSFLAPRNPQSLLVRTLGAATRPAILDAMNGGLSLLSYVGHGGSAVWASENVLNSFDPPALLAQPQQPLMLTMNCLNGYFVQPNLDSLAEAFLKAEGRGTIAAFSPSGLSLDGPAHVFHRALVNEIVNGNHARLGDAVLAAQQAYALSGHMPELLAVYNLLGDPAMRVQ